MPTIREVAEKSGVSAMSVSRVLSHGPQRKRCSESVIRRVEEAAEQLGYRVNYHMRSVRNKRSDTIGLVVELDIQKQGNQTGDWYFAQIYDGVQAAAQENGLMVLQVRPNPRENNLSAIEQGVHFIQERRLDGLVVIETTDQREKILAVAETVLKNIPITIIEPHLKTSFNEVRFDHQAGVNMLVDHLASLGHHHLLWLGPVNPSKVHPDREQQFLKAAFARGMQGQCCHFQWPENDHVFETEIQHINKALNDFLDKHPLNFTAIVAYNDLIALAAYQVLAQRGIPIPQQVSVTGFDDSHAVLGSPSLTTVSHELFEMGRRAGHITIDMISSSSKKHKQKCETISPKLIVRNSTGPTTPLP